MSMNAQAGYYTKHEIGISYGFGSNSDIVNGFGGALRCFAELGIGEQGMALLGIRYKF